VLSRDLHPEPFRIRWGRRLIVYAAFLLLTVVFTLLNPVFLLRALVLDLRLNTSWRNLRVLAFFCGYVYFYWIALLRLAFGWLTARPWSAGFQERLARSAVDIGIWWSDGLFGLVERVFDLRIEVEDDRLLDRGPLIIFMRHASLPDTLLGLHLVTGPHGIRVRHVVKRENLWDPCVDLGLHRYPNVFIERNPTDTDHEIQILAAVMEDLGQREAVMMFPEGTRFAPEKRERRLAMIKEKHPELYERARAMRNVLPPRPAGTLALLVGNEKIGADAIFCAHTGFERARHLRDFLNGSLLGTTVRVKFWRVSYAEIPKDHYGRIDWLYAWWRRVDDWIGEHSA